VILRESVKSLFFGGHGAVVPLAQVLVVDKLVVFAAFEQLTPSGLFEVVEHRDHLPDLVVEHNVEDRHGV